MKEAGVYLVSINSWKQPEKPSLGIVSFHRIIIEWLRLEGTSKPTELQPRAMGWLPPTHSDCPEPHPWPWHLQGWGTHSAQGSLPPCSPSWHSRPWVIPLHPGLHMDSQHASILRATECPQPWPGAAQNECRGLSRSGGKVLGACAPTLGQCSRVC